MGEGWERGGEGWERGEKDWREGGRDGRGGKGKGEGRRDITHILCHIANQLIYMYSNPYQLSCPGSSVGRALA